MGKVGVAAAAVVVASAVATAGGVWRIEASQHRQDSCRALQARLVTAYANIPDDRTPNPDLSHLDEADAEQVNVDRAKYLELAKTASPSTKRSMPDELNTFARVRRIPQILASHNCSE